MTKTGPAAEHASARAFNDYHPLGTPVRYWKGIREGDGKVARTRTEAQLLGGHTAVVWLEGVSGCIALTHIQPITEEELSAADRIPAPRPVPTLHVELAAARQTAAFRLGVIDRHRQELGAAGEVLAVVWDAVERIERARAAYDTTPGEATEREDEATPERVAEDIAAAIETHFLPDNLTAIQAARIARHHATQYGQAAALGSPRRAQEATETDVPDWVLELIRGLAKYEAEHPKLYRQTGDWTHEQWPCPCSLLEGVPKAIREQARP